LALIVLAIGYFYIKGGSNEDLTVDTPPMIAQEEVNLTNYEDKEEEITEPT
jgi:hypothetical protein